jgi:hypothetical protein
MDDPNQFYVRSTASRTTVTRSTTWSANFHLMDAGSTTDDMTYNHWLDMTNAWI